MRKLLLASAAVLISGTAFAADLPVRSSAPSFIAPTPIAFSWTGFYAGLNAGYGWNSSRWTSTTAPALFTPFNTDGNGFVGGGHVGYNWQMNQFVFGLEGQLKYSDIRGSAQCSTIAGTVCRTRQNWIGDISGRLGIAADRALFFVTGGVAFTDYSFRNPVPAPTVSWGGGSRTGWTIGAGIDYAITNNWIAGIEYKYYDFGSATSNASLGVNPIRFRETTSVIQGRLSYKFGGPASPVVARF